MKEAVLLVGNPKSAETIRELARVRAGDFPLYTAGPESGLIAAELRRFKQEGVAHTAVQPLASFLDLDSYEHLVSEIRSAMRDLGLEPSAETPGPESRGFEAAGGASPEHVMFSGGSMTVELLGPLFEGGGAAEQVTDRSRRRVSSMRSYRAVPAARIQPMSFDMISRSMDLLSFPADSGRRQVIVRAVHATADFSLADRFHFTPGAVQRGRAALENPSVPVVTDVNMVAAGIGRLFSGRVVCRVADPEAARLARESGLTRSAAAMELVKDRLHGALVAIGNAPTALVHLLQIITRDGIQPGLIVGVPVGLVGAAEAKEMLVDSGVPCITVLGNRGGSTVASAVVNALGTLPLPGDHDAGTSKAGSPDGGTPDAGTTGTGSPA